MIKHSQIIDQLSVQQKIALLTDVTNLSNPELNAMGVPQVTMDTLENLSTQAVKAYPPAAALANSWDTTLMEASALDIANTARATGVNLIEVPTAKPRCNMYMPGLCEDPYLSGIFTGAFISGVHKAGSASIVPDFSVADTDIEYFDSTPSKRIVYHFFISPYMQAMKKCKAEAVVTSTKMLKDYGDINRSFIDQVAKSQLGTTVFADAYSFDETLRELVKGNLCLKGAASSLASAVANYQSLQKSILEGSGSIEDLNMTIEEGSAVSPEMLDAALDKLFDFADACNRQASSSATSCAQAASLESVVLLKNKFGILPVKEKKKIAIIGDVDGLSGSPNYIGGLTAYAKTLDFEFIGHAPGYNVEENISEELLSQAESLAGQADMIWLFLGTNKEYEANIHNSMDLALPANQQALIDRLSQFGDKTVAIVSSGYPVDMGWDRDYQSVIWAPIEGTYSAYALINVIFGKFNPVGRMSISLYEDTNDWFQQIKNNRDSGRNKVGQFIGYYNYDSSNISVRYPFGFGLSYTTFTYSKFSVKGTDVTFTITNTGSMAGKETAQIYVGNEGSAVMTPNKELKAFVQVKLNPGESQEVTVPIENLEFYDPDTDSMILQSGIYDLYIGPSVSNIKIMDEMTVAGKDLAKTGEKKKDYLQSESNIIDDDFRLRATSTPAKLKKWTGLLAGGIAATLIGIACAIVSVLMLKNDGILIQAAVAAICGLVGVSGIGLIVWAAIRLKDLSKKKQIEKTAPDRFKHAERVSSSQLDDIFEKEFENFKFDDEEETANKEDEGQAFVDKNITFSKICKQFLVFSNERGLGINYSQARLLLSSMATSRLMLIRAPKQIFDLTVAIMNAYFFSQNTLQDLTGAESPLDLFYKKNGSRLEETPFAKAAAKGTFTASQISFVGLQNVKLSSIDGFFSPVIKYISNPNKVNMIELKSGINRAIEVPSNLWICMNVCGDENLDALPKHIADLACFINLEAGECTKKDKKTPITKVDYDQFQYMTQVAKREFELEEDTWKKIDRLEDLVAKYSPYHMSNKLCMRTEQFAATMLACNSDASEALDFTLAYKFLPVIVSVLRNAENYDAEKFTETFGAIFGDDSISQCQKVIALSSLQVSQQ